MTSFVLAASVLLTDVAVPHLWQEQKAVARLFPAHTVVCRLHTCACTGVAIVPGFLPPGETLPELVYQVVSGFNANQPKFVDGPCSVSLLLAFFRMETR